MKKLSGLTVLLLVVAIAASGCAVAERAVEDWDTGVSLYTDTEVKYNNCILSSFTANQKMTAIFMVIDRYAAGNVALAEQWAAGQAGNAAMLQQAQEYQAAATPNAEGHLDLAALEAAGYDPNTIAGGLTVQITALSVVQAQVPIQSDQLYRDGLDELMEALNYQNSQCTDYNFSVGAYNTWVHSAEPSVVTEVARRLGLTYLPENLTGFTGAAFPNPLITTPSQ